MSGGELFQRFQGNNSFPEKELVATIKPVIDAVRYCHELDIAHRDLKPENLLFESNDANAQLKITDFGFARFQSQDQYMSTLVGTPYYVAPEILRGEKYTNKIDCWSIGIIIYLLIAGYPPFINENNEALYEEIKAGQFDFPDQDWEEVSNEAKDLIQGLLKLNPEERLSAEDILQHDWFKMWED